MQESTGGEQYRVQEYKSEAKVQEYRMGSTVYIVQESTGGGSRSTGTGNSSAGVDEAVKLEAGYRVTQHQLLATTASSACALLSLSLN